MQMIKYKEMNTSTCFELFLPKFCFIISDPKKYGLVLILPFSGCEFFNKTEKGANFFRGRC